MSQAELPVVDDVMSTTVFTLDADQDLADAYHQLSTKRFSGVPVMRDGAVVGMLSETDALRGLAAAAFNGGPVGSVGSAMRTPVVSVARGADLFQVIDTLRTHGVRRAPVLDNGELVGIVTVKDADRALLGVLQSRSVLKRPHHTPGAAWE